MNYKEDENPRVVIVTGFSGAGKSLAIKALEDLSFYCVDNLPLELVEPTLHYFLNNFKSKKFFAFGLDSRSDRFVENFFEVKSKISKKITLEILFMDCENNEIVKRFSTTRRKHPLLEKGGELLSAVQKEKIQLQKIKNSATKILDTSMWKSRNVADAMEVIFANDIKERSLNITLISFGFKHGPLTPADNIMDVRFLKNPYYEPLLKEKNGLTPEIKDFVLKEDLTKTFLEKIKNFYNFLLPNYYQEGKHYLRIGIGCTGGKHRSVVVTEELANFISSLQKITYNVSVVHRDIDRP